MNSSFGRRGGSPPDEPAEDDAQALPAPVAYPAEPPQRALLSPREIALIRASVAAVEPFIADMTVYFYGILFARYPQVRGMFPQPMDAQRGRLLRALLRIVDLLDDPRGLGGFCAHLGRDHRKFGTLTGHYPAVGDCLTTALARFCGPAWDEETADAWAKAYAAAAHAMSSAAERDALSHPAAWDATVVGHTLYEHGIAEITVRPDLPYPFQAGQYVSVETPWWPQQWRSHSPANAPRPDGTLTFHVRAVPGGRVSTALVHHSAVGHRVRLGRAMGTMTLDAVPATATDLLCVAGGTGLAPIKALIEETDRRGAHHRVDLFIGARTSAELYGLNEMLRMAQRHHWLSVRAAVSHEHLPGAHGSLSDVLAEFGPWYEHDAYLSGPPDMVTTASRTLTVSGVPPERIHHDPLETPVLAAQ